MVEPSKVSCSSPFAELPFTKVSYGQHHPISRFTILLSSLAGILPLTAFDNSDKLE